ncbi:right-handed parallel beta-helix repeat-containing protein [Desulfogranum marinum]|uniref:right-handed parallel beta-helix repeat-containing protein n=1 Tax=Desulfogranum marinum TaxID=453220 RepID=UPI0029C7DCD6|nr:right-handed parallel beta-helix repeat-containing protein [Desulfogranum marinum]
MSLKNFKQIKKTIVINFLFLTFFCHVPFSTLHAQPGYPKDLQPRGNGNTYFVAKNGNNNSSGLTAASAWATISKVNKSRFSPGDRILFKRGDTWKEQLVIPSSGSASGGSITFGAYGTGNKPVIDGAGVNLSRNHGLIRGSGKNYIIIEDIRVQNAGIGKAAENTGIGFYGGSYITVRNCEAYNTESSGLKFNTSSHITVDGNEISKACRNSRSESLSLSVIDTFEVMNNTVYDGGTAAGGGAGIDAKDGSHDGSIHHNEVYGINGANAIYVDAYGRYTYNIEIYANYIHDTDGAGFQIGSESGGLLKNVSVHHNVVHNALRGAIAFHNKYPASGAVQDIFIYNNTFYQNGTNGTGQYGNIRVWDQLIDNLVIKNNIMGQNHNFHVGIHTATGPAPSKYTVGHNVLSGTQKNAGGFAAVDGSNSIKSDPLFVNSSADNFRLQSGSPAKKACDNSVWQGTPNITDYDGVALTDEKGAIVASVGKVSCGAYQ